MTLTLTIAALISIVGQVEPDAAPSGKAGFAELSADERLAFVKKEAAAYELVLGTTDGPKLTLAEPVLRFNDNVSGVIDAVVVLWLHDGRPEASASIWHRKDGLVAHEFQSFSEGRLFAKRGNKIVWQPQTPGIAPKLLKDAPPPAKTAPGRLSQMRTVIRRFNATVQSRSGPLHLRLLPQPVARYGKENTPVLDAAWFAFAKGTNPEVMVLVEARRGAGGYVWHYAPVRMSSKELRLKLGKNVVWTVKRTRNESPQDTYYNIYSND